MSERRRHCAEEYKRRIVELARSGARLRDWHVSLKHRRAR
jgi:hypothetical protein